MQSKRIKILPVIFLTASIQCANAQTALSGATETTPSRSEYFSWINNTNEGATEAHTLTNLDFFKYMKDTYGMQLDIYAFDAGAIDGSKRYGSVKSADFRKQFPNGFQPLAAKASSMDTKLGIWCGPDGFGDTPEEAAERSEMMVSLVKDYNFGLFKMDAVCGQLRKDKYDYFLDMMSQIRTMDPDFVLLNHRLNLGPGTKYSTTYLLGGAETYIDILMTNTMTAPHHRAQAISREVPKTRLTEDHGVCLSTCLDFWDDDLILQAFNRSLILAPELYGSPWFLSDEELPQLAFIFNLHRDNRDILVNGLELPEAQYGPKAMSRGDGSTRFITLRNLSWETKRYTISLSEEVGLDKSGKNVQVRLYHPYIYDMGRHSFGSSVEVEVAPYRSCLVKVTTIPENDRITVSGIPYRIINDRVGDTLKVKLLGEPGRSYKYSISCGRKTKKGSVSFPGTPRTLPTDRHLASLERCDIPKDISAIYYATVFSASNNALEGRCMDRSGETAIPQVKAARDAFFNQRTFVERGILDRNLFDGNPDTYYNIAFRWGDQRFGKYSSFMLDLGQPQQLDRLEILTDTEYSLSPLRIMEGTRAQVSNDLVHWQQITFVNRLNSVIDLSKAGEIRYIRFPNCPIRIAEVTGYRDGKAVDRSKWRASNLFDYYGGEIGKASRVWKCEVTLDEIPENSYLCIAVNGKHGKEGAWAGCKVDGQYVGCPDRAPSYLANSWECPVRDRESGYTFYLPLTADMKGKKIEAFVMSMKWAEFLGELTPELYISNYPYHFASKVVTVNK